MDSPARNTPVWRKRLFLAITPIRIIITILLLTGVYLFLIATFAWFQYLPYFRFFLLCLMGSAFLVITFLLRQ